MCCPISIHSSGKHAWERIIQWYEWVWLHDEYQSTPALTCWPACVHLFQKSAVFSLEIFLYQMFTFVCTTIWVTWWKMNAAICLLTFQTMRFLPANCISHLFHLTVSKSSDHIYMHTCFILGSGVKIAYLSRVHTCNVHKYDNHYICLTCVSKFNRSTVIWNHVNFTGFNHTFFFIFSPLTFELQSFFLLL